MAVSEAQHRANEKYNAKTYDEIKLRVHKGKKEIIQVAAQIKGESVNAFITRLIDNELNTMQMPTGGDFHI